MLFNIDWDQMVLLGLLMLNYDYSRWDSWFGMEKDLSAMLG